MSWLWLPQDLYCELLQSDGHFLGKVTRMTVPAKRISSFSTCHPALILKDTGIDKRSEVLLHRDTPLANPLFEMDDIDSTVIETSSSPKHEIRPEQIISLIIAPISSCLLAYLLLVLFTYLFSCLFVFGSWVFQLLFLAELRMDFIPCSAAGILCLTAYVVIKHVIRGTTKSRLKSKLYVFNAFVMLATFNFVSRGSRYDKENDVCSIGLERTILLPVIFFDAVVNVYLTSLFLFPLMILFTAFVIHWINSSGKATPISNVEVAPTPAPPPPSIELGEKEVVTFTEIFDQRRKSYDDHEP
ncbi:uncharacterized protein CLUP02_12162 [Colletotrichum lupini]|uniref:Uncharacterized protein n=1 Tax=Colletotrichum lupini TaxID=145971 RepID=A0A9Q8WL53_9PEZI|nr:uncharacterized protein CLUP02_12162 [Colletotrichum lupini]UQC86660.1 hypothetical protein CLUP02_12162 [Colletotrichum lupini]